MKRGHWEVDNVVETGGKRVCEDDSQVEQPQKGPSAIPSSAKNLRAEIFTITTVGDKMKCGSCNLCAMVIKMANGNTTGLKRHLERYHPEKYLQIYPDAVSTGKKNRTKGKTVFSQEGFENLLVDWAAENYLPFSFFDNDRTQELFQYLNPSVSVPKRNLVRAKTIERFTKMQTAVMNILRRNDSKISFTVDAWTSVSQKSYYGITGHFIDKNWSLQSLAIDFVPSNGAHSGKEIAKLFHGTLKEFSLLDKVHGITLDNASANTKFVEQLAPLMLRDGVIFDSENQHFRCFAHIINLAVNDMLRVVQHNIDDADEREEEAESDGDEETYEDGKSVLTKLKKLFVKIKYSEQWTNKLKSCCETTNSKMLSPNLGVSTRWNSTCDMVQTAIQMKQALNLLCENNAVLNVLRVSEREWILLAELLKLLRHFKVLSVALSGDKYATLPLVVIGINMMLDKIEGCIKSYVDDPRSPVSTVVYEAVGAAREKILKHYLKANWMYCVVLILDPRHKIETFQKTAWGRDMASQSVYWFEEIYRRNYYEPKISLLPSSHEPIHLNSASDIEHDDLLDLGSLFASSSSTDVPNESNWRSELDEYLGLNRAEKNDDILIWWRNHEKRFPTVASMARDFLAIQATSVSVERFFSKASLVIRKHRNRLNNESARTLLCLNSWINCSLSTQIGSELAAKEDTAKKSVSA